jgi:hypothetical protein
MVQSSTYTDDARQVSAPAATSSVATSTTAYLDTLDSLDLDFGCSFMAKTGPNDTRTDTTFYLAPPATHLVSTLPSASNDTGTDTTFYLAPPATHLVSTLPCASIEARASIEAPFDPRTNYRNIELFQK